MQYKDLAWFCPEPFTSLETTTDGHGMVCCWSSISTPDNIQSSFIDGLYNSNTLIEIRKSILENKTPQTCKILQKYCNICFTQEHNGVESWRKHKTKSMDYELDNLTAYIPLEKAPIKSIKLRIFGITCNLKCLMCSEDRSSKIAAELGKYNSDQFNIWSKLNKQLLYADLIKIMPSVTSIKFTSGEPFLSEDISEFFQWLLDNGFNHLQITISTNGTVQNDNFVSQLNKFKKTRLHFSIDGVNNLDEYIRHGTKWNNKIETIKYWQSNLINAEHICWTTVQALNVVNIQEISNFCIESNLIQEFHLLTGPRFLSLETLPMELKQKYSEIIPEYFCDIHTELKKESNHQKKLWNQFVRYINLKDMIRNQSIFSVRPEMQAYF